MKKLTNIFDASTRFLPIYLPSIKVFRCQKAVQARPKLLKHKAQPGCYWTSRYTRGAPWTAAKFQGEINSRTDRDRPGGADWQSTNVDEAEAGRKQSKLRKLSCFSAAPSWRDPVGSNYILWIPVPTKLSGDTGRVVPLAGCLCFAMSWNVLNRWSNCATLCILHQMLLGFLTPLFKVEKNPPKPGLYRHPLQKKKHWFLLPADSSKPTHDCCIISLMRNPPFSKA